MTAKKKVTAVGKHPAHAKPAAAKTAAKSRESAKHKTTSSKHGATSKHTSTKAAPKKRGLALEGVPCCAAQAVAASARLAGLRVGDGDVLELHWRAGGTVTEGVTIAAALAAASVFGLRGQELVAGKDAAHASLAWPVGAQLGPAPHGLILGVDVHGGPHAVCLDREPGVCWSWGEPHSLARLALGPADEAWAVMWA